MSACHRQHHGVANDAAQSGQVRLEQAGNAARFGLIEQCAEHGGSVAFICDHQHVNTTATRVKHVACPFAAHVDIRDECCTWNTNPQLANALEVGAAIYVQVEDYDIDWPTFASASEGGPIFARDEAIAIARRRAEPSVSLFVCE